MKVLQWLADYNSTDKLDSILGQIKKRNKNE